MENKEKLIDQLIETTDIIKSATLTVENAAKTLQKILDQTMQMMNTRDDDEVITIEDDEEEDGSNNKKDEKFEDDEVPDDFPRSNQEHEQERLQVERMLNKNVRDLISRKRRRSIEYYDPNTCCTPKGRLLDIERPLEEIPSKKKKVVNLDDDFDELPNPDIQNSQDDEKEVKTPNYRETTTKHFIANLHCDEIIGYTSPAEEIEDVITETKQKINNLIDNYATVDITENKENIPPYHQDSEDQNKSDDEEVIPSSQQDLLANAKDLRETAEKSIPDGKTPNTENLNNMIDSLSPIPETPRNAQYMTSPPEHRSMLKQKININKKNQLKKKKLLKKAINLKKAITMKSEDVDRYLISETTKKLNILSPRRPIPNIHLRFYSDGTPRSFPDGTPRQHAPNIPKVSLS